MAIQSSFYAPDGSTRTFPSTKHIASKQHMAVWFRRLADSVWVVQDVASYELINNTAVLQEAPSVALYDNIEIRVADTQDELIDSPSDIVIVAGLAAEIAELSSEPVATYLATAAGNATTAQLEAWNAEAEKLTSDSYANEPEDVFVKSYSSNGDGTFTSTPTTDYSALHYAAKTNSDKVLDLPDFAALQIHDIAYSTKVHLTELYSGIKESGGVFWYNPLTDKATADAIDIIDVSVSLELQGTGIGIGCWIRSIAIKHLLVPNATTAFGMPVKEGTLLYQLDTNHSYRATSLLSATNTISDGNVLSMGTSLYDFNIPMTTVATSNTGTDYYNEPMLALCSDGSIICVYRHAADHAYTNGGIVAAKKSEDNGVTWGSEIVVAAGGAGFESRNHSVIVDPVTGLVTVFYRTYDAVGALHIDLFYVNSSDGGLTWGTPTNISALFSDITFDGIVVFGKIVVTTNGLASIFYATNAATNNQYAYCLFSTDGGLTWGNRSNIYTLTQSAGTFVEPSVIAIDTSRLICVVRDNQNGSHFYIYNSVNGGITWTGLGYSVWTTTVFTTAFPVALEMVGNEIVISWGARSPDYYLYTVRMNADAFFRYPHAAFTDEVRRRLWRSNTELGTATDAEFGYPSLLAIPGIEHTVLCAWYDSKDGTGATDTDIMLMSTPRY